MVPQGFKQALSFDRSPVGYRLRADVLTEMAEDTRDRTWAVALRARALEWRKLATTAGWQEAMSAALR